MESFTEPGHMMAFFHFVCAFVSLQTDKHRVEEGVGELGNEAKVEEKVWETNFGTKSCFVKAENMGWAQQKTHLVFLLAIYSDFLTWETLSSRKLCVDYEWDINKPLKLSKNKVQLRSAMINFFRAYLFNFIFVHFCSFKHRYLYSIFSVVHCSVLFRYVQSLFSCVQLHSVTFLVLFCSNQLGSVTFSHNQLHSVTISYVHLQ